MSILDPSNVECLNMCFLCGHYVWVFVLRDYTGDDVNRIRRFYGVYANYILISYEEDVYGQPYLHCFIRFTKRRKFNAVKTICPKDSVIDICRHDQRRALYYLKLHMNFDELGDYDCIPVSID